MINLKNNGDVVYIKEANSNQKFDYIYLNKPLILQPYSQFIINTKLFIECTEDAEMGVLIGGIDVDSRILKNVGDHHIEAEIYTKQRGLQEIIIDGVYCEDEPLTLPKNIEIARIFYTYLSHNDRVYDNSKDYKKSELFNNGDILICSLKGNQYKVEQIYIPNTEEKYIKINLDEEVTQ